jgi:proteasome-associated ATPase
VIFFDELDTYGSRGEGVGQDIDGRVLGALLSEIDGLEHATDILCIGATNRLDLCDAALIRQQRLGDRVYTIPRPGREATREILGHYLDAELAYASQGAEALAAAATSYLHAANDGAGVLATVTLRSGDTREIRARDVLSGALLASAVEQAKHAAAQRELQATRYAAESDKQTEDVAGIRYEDLLTALDQALGAEAEKLAAPHVARRTLDIPRADEIARVDVVPERRKSPERRLRVV